MRLHHFVAGGWAQDFGAVLIGEHVDGQLRYFGEVASRFDNLKLKSLTKNLPPRKASPFIDPIAETDVRFCELTLRVPVQFLVRFLVPASRGQKEWANAPLGPGFQAPAPTARQAAPQGTSHPISSAASFLRRPPNRPTRAKPISKACSGRSIPKPGGKSSSHSPPRSLLRKRKSGLK